MSAAVVSRAVRASLNYVARPPAGKITGRVIVTGGANHPQTASSVDPEQLVDEHVARTVDIADGRVDYADAKVEEDGFALVSGYPAGDSRLTAGAIVGAATGAPRVVVFDHTLRQSSSTGSMNAGEKGTAAAVFRVHADYTPESGPARLEKLVREGVVQRQSVRGRFAFVNVWRSIDLAQPVLSHPLALCVESSVDLKGDAWPYLMVFPDRVGANYALDAAHFQDHRWLYYPEMVAEEALVFKTFDTDSEKPRFVFHTSFDLPQEGPPRTSVEFRAIALWDD